MNFGLCLPIRKDPGIENINLIEVLSDFIIKNQGYIFYSSMFKISLRINSQCLYQYEPFL